MRKKMLTSVLALGLTLSLGFGIAMAGNGNDLPPGPRYMLNVIAFAKDNCPAGDFTGSNRHMIAVEAGFTPDGSGDLATIQTGNKNNMIRTNTIKLAQGDDFQVLDGNACGSKGGAEFMLPADPFYCDLNGNGVIDDNEINSPECTGEDLSFQEYQVFVRLVGRPNTGIGVTTCAFEPDGADVDGDGVIDEILCSTENVIKVRSTGKGAMKFEDKTRELLTICLDTYDDMNFDGSCDVRYALFDPALMEYFWQWNTSGKAHAQLVFIPIPD